VGNVWLPVLYGHGASLHERLVPGPLARALGPRSHMWQHQPDGNPKRLGSGREPTTLFAPLPIFTTTSPTCFLPHKRATSD